MENVLNSALKIDLDYHRSMKEVTFVYQSYGESNLGSLISAQNCVGSRGLRIMSVKFKRFKWRGGYIVKFNTLAYSSVMCSPFPKSTLMRSYGIFSLASVCLTDSEGGPSDTLQSFIFCGMNIVNQIFLLVCVCKHNFLNHIIRESLHLPTRDRK